MKYQKERTQLDQLGFDNISTSGGCYKVWPKGTPREAAVVVTADQLLELVEMNNAARIKRGLTAIANTATTDTMAVDPKTMAVSTLEMIDDMNNEKTNPKAAATTTKKAASKKAAPSGEARAPKRAATPPADASPSLKMLLEFAQANPGIGSVGQKFADLYDLINKATPRSPVKLSHLEGSYMKKKARRLAEYKLVASEKLDDKEIIFYGLANAATAEAEPSGAKKGGKKGGDGSNGGGGKKKEKGAAKGKAEQPSAPSAPVEQPAQDAPAVASKRAAARASKQSAKRAPKQSAKRPAARVSKPATGGKATKTTRKATGARKSA